MADRGGFIDPNIDIEEDGPQGPQHFARQAELNWRDRLANWLHPNAPVPWQTKEVLGAHSASPFRGGIIDSTLVPTAVDVAEHALRGQPGWAAGRAAMGLIPYGTMRGASSLLNRALRNKDFYQRYPDLARDFKFGQNEMDGVSMNWRLGGNQSISLGETKRGRFVPSEYIDEIQAKAAERAKQDIDPIKSWGQMERDILDARDNNLQKIRDALYGVMDKIYPEIPKSLFQGTSKTDTQALRRAMRLFEQMPPPPRNQMHSFAAPVAAGGFFLPRPMDEEPSE